MRDEVRLTAETWRLSGVAVTRQDPSDALDVGAYKALDLAARLYGTEGTSPSVTFYLQGSMQNAKDDDALWVTLATFAALSTAGTTAMVSVTTGLPRYVRWKADVSGTSPAVTFTITGMGHRG